MARGPFLSSITATFFVNLINRLGVRPPPPDGFDLVNTVQPVSIVDSEAGIISADTSQLLDVPFSAGTQTNPGTGFVLADTGPQNAGNWLLFMLLQGIDAGGNPSISVQRRDAANATNVWVQQIIGTVTGSLQGLIPLKMRVVLQQGERVRLVTSGPTTAGSLFQASIWIAPS